MQVYDDNDDYSEDVEREEEVVRPRFGFDLFSVFVPVSNFFAVIWKLFCNFVLKLEKQVKPILFRINFFGCQAWGEQYL